MQGLKDEILSRIDKESYYSSKLNFTEKKGKNWKALCPFHAETSPSFYVEMSTGRWYCQGSCSKGGDIIAFQQEYAHQDFGEALRELAKQAGVEVPEVKRGRPRNEVGDENSSEKKTRSRYPELTDESIAELHKNLTQDDRDYLHSRAITDEVIDRLLLGHWDHPALGHVLVWPVRRGDKWHNLRFYRRASDRAPKDIRQMSKEQLGHEPIWLFPEPDPQQEKVYLFEGEPDCMCALSLGLNATTVTGGAGTWMEDFNAHFKDKIVYVCYDVDDKGKIGAKAVAAKISKITKEVRIVRLGLDPEKHPKGDFNDFIVREKKTLADFLKICEEAKIEPKLDIDIELNVVEDDGAYWSVTTNRKGEAVQKKISTWTIRMLCRFITQEGGIEREVIITSQDSKKESDRRMLTPKDMSTLRGFREFIFGCGDFVFDGDDTNLNSIWHLVCAQDPDAKVVRSIYQAGFIEDHGLWLFANAAVKHNEPIIPDTRGICWNGRMGYSLMPFNTRGKSARGIPSFDITTDSFEDTKKVIKAFSDNLAKTFGTFLAPLGIGLAVGSLYFNDILFNRELGCFPMLFVQGSWQSGKTEYMSMLMRMFGLEKSDIESLQDITSTVPVTRRLSYYSNVPIFYDEYRDNSPRIQQIVGTLRSAYDGSGRSLGVKGSFGVVSEIIRAPVMLAGEHVPTDEAFKSRLIPIQVREAWRKPEFHADATQSAIDSNRHLYNCIRFKTKETTKELIERIFDIKRRIKTAKPHLGERALKNYAIALGCYSYLVSNDDPVLFDSVIDGTGIQQLDRDTEEPDQQDPNVKRTLNEFIDIVQLAIESKRILSTVAWYHIVEGEDLLYIWLTPLYEAYADICRRQNQTPVNLRTIIMHFQDSECFRESNKQHKMPIGDTFKWINKKCLTFQLSNLNSGIRGWIGGEM